MSEMCSGLKRVLEEYPDGTFLKIDGYDEAVIGVDIRNDVLVYSKGRIMSKLFEDMCEEDAIEFFDYNIAGSWMGEKTPIIVDLV